MSMIDQEFERRFEVFVLIYTICIICIFFVGGIMVKLG